MKHIFIKSITSKIVWEQYVLAVCPHALFQSWYWGRVHEVHGDKIWRFGIYCGSGLAGIMQVLKVRAKRGTYLHIRHGPVLSDHTIDYWQIVCEEMKNLGRLERALFIRMSPLISDTAEHRLHFHKLGLKKAAIPSMDGERCWVLDINKSEEELLSNMRKTTRYEIRRAQKLPIRVRKSQRGDDLEAFLNLYAATATRHHFVPHAHIREEFRVFAGENKAILFLGELKGTITSSAIVLFYGDQAIYHHGASLPTREPVSYMVQWEAIREAKIRGFPLYNFWGIAPEDNPNHPWSGHSLFKKGFGGRKEEFLHAYDYPIHPFYYLTRSIEIFHRVSKGY